MDWACAALAQHVLTQEIYCAQRGPFAAEHPSTAADAEVAAEKSPK